MANRSVKPAERSAVILLTVLVVIALLTVGSAAYFDWTFSEHRATRMYGRQTQTRYAAESGVEVLRALLAEDAADIESAGGLYDNPNRFKGVILIDDEAPADRCRTSVLAPNIDYGEYSGVRFGLENESSRLNLNTLLALDQTSDSAARTQLMALPGMTESIADAILDWIDPDEEVREYGAELTHYAALDPAYGPQNGPLESLDQLLLVRDVTPELLYGLDRNRDMLVDDVEAAGALPDDVENIDGQMNRGWSAYLTVYSAERELNPDGEPKINVNSEDLETLHQAIEAKLGRGIANFVVAYRQSGPNEEGEASATKVNAEGVQVDFDSAASVTIDSIARLVGAEVAVVQAGQNQQEVIEAIIPAELGLGSSTLLEMLDHLTVYSDEVVPGRLNVNQAPRSLLYGVPGMPIEVVESIIGDRDFDPAEERPERRHAEWLFLEGYLTLEEMQAVAPLLTSGGAVYRAQVYGFYDEEGPRRRLEVVIDATSDAPTVVYQHDLSPLGGGPEAAELGAQVEQDGEETADSGAM